VSSKWKKIRLCRIFLKNICHHGATWYAISALIAHVAHLGSRMDHLTRFKDLNRRFEGLGI
jgi:hypothetical protein